MEAGKLIPFIITLAISVVCFLIAYFQAKERGPVFTNAYLFASKEERERLDRTPEYRLAKTVFLVFGIVFLILSVEVLMDWKWLAYILAGMIIALVVYVIAVTMKKLK